eukprot:TRINITY_DN1093_c1_g2_i3.p1 TRINITY_DN1093_c1_g2~~TRINITY_DN1093_c1_g2_i3.p1  ORF type:complete len:366 (+),score=85.74 TRINITY_DN1093_c1_g2_i3:1151-2248(+)
MNKALNIQKVIVIGGGLGGLGFARAMKIQNPSIKVQVFERDSYTEKRPQGWVIGLNKEGIQSLRKMNIKGLEDFLSINDGRAFNVVDQNWNLYLSVGDKNQDITEGGVVNRWELHKLLLDGVDVIYGKKFIKYEENDNQVIAFFEDGTQYSADFLVGSDGVNSRVREQRCPNLVLEDVGVTTMGGSVEMPSDPRLLPRIKELLDRSSIRLLTKSGFSVIMLKYKDENGKTSICWGASQPNDNSNLPPIPTSSSSAMKQYAVGAAQSLGNKELELLFSLTPTERIFKTRDLKAIKVPSSSSKSPPPMSVDQVTRVTLLGDSAHAMTTHRGLGKTSTSYSSSSSSSLSLHQRHRRNVTVIVEIIHFS